MKLDENNVYYIYVLGAGGTGSNLLPFLAQLLNKYDVNALKIIDGDHVEIKNRDNQRFLESDINYNKAEVLADKFTRFYKKLFVTYLPHYITDENYLINMIYSECVADKIITIVPIIVGCVDNNATRKILHKVFYSTALREVIYIDSGNGTDNRIGQVVVGYRQYKIPKEKEKGLFEPDVILKPVCDVFPEILKDEDTIDNALSCDRINTDAPQNVATNVMAAATIFAIINNIIAFGEINTYQSFFSVNTESVEVISKEV